MSEVKTVEVKSSIETKTIEKKKWKSPIKGENENVSYYKIDDTSISKKWNGKTTFDGNWRREVKDPDTGEINGIYYLNLKNGDPDGEVKGFEIYDNKEVETFTGGFKSGKPIGVHFRYLYDEEKKERILIRKDYYKNFKLDRMETYVNGEKWEGTVEELEQKFEKENGCDEPKKKSVRNKTKSENKEGKDHKEEKDYKEEKEYKNGRISPSELKTVCDDLEITYEGQFPKKEDIQEECKTRGLTGYSKKSILKMIKMIKKDKNE